MLHLETLLDRWLVILLTGTELLDDTCLFKLSLELLESSLDVLAFLYGYNNHFVLVYKFLIRHDALRTGYNAPSTISGCKITSYFSDSQTFTNFLRVFFNYPPKQQVQVFKKIDYRRFVVNGLMAINTRNVQTKKANGNRLYYLKEDWEAERRKAEDKSYSTKEKRNGAS